MEKIKILDDLKSLSKIKIFSILFKENQIFFENS